MKNKSISGKMIVAELMGGDGIRQYLESICHLEPKNDDLTITIVDKEITEFCKTQIYGLSGIQNAV